MDKVGWLTRWRLKGSPIELSREELLEVPELAFDLLRRDWLTERFKYKKWELLRIGTCYMLIEESYVICHLVQLETALKTFREKTEPMDPAVWREMLNMLLKYFEAGVVEGGEGDADPDTV